MLHPVSCLLADPGLSACRALAGMQGFPGSLFVSRVQPTERPEQMRNFSWPSFWSIMVFAPGDCGLKGSLSVLGYGGVSIWWIKQTQGLENVKQTAEIDNLTNSVAQARTTQKAQINITYFF